MLSFLMPRETLFILCCEVTKIAREALDVITVFDFDVVFEVCFVFEWFSTLRTLKSDVILTLHNEVCCQTLSSLASGEHFTTFFALIFPISPCLLPFSFTKCQLVGPVYYLFMLSEIVSP